jgi:thiamine biosynthesis protein ThiS
MRVTFNGGTILLEQNTDLLHFLEQKKLNPEKVVIEYNGGIAPQSEWPDIHLQDGDIIYALSFVGGG